MSKRKNTNTGPGRPRTHGCEAEIRIRLTAEQKAAVDAAAEAGETLQAYCLERILGK